MERKYIRFINKTNQSILLDTFVIGANSTLDLQEYMLNDQIQRRIKSLVNLNRISYDIVTISIPELKPDEINPQANVIVEIKKPEEKLEILNVKNVPVVEMTVTDNTENINKVEEVKPKKRGRKKTKKD